MYLMDKCNIRVKCIYEYISSEYKFIIVLELDTNIINRTIFLDHFKTIPNAHMG